MYRPTKSLTCKQWTQKKLKNAFTGCGNGTGKKTMAEPESRTSNTMVSTQRRKEMTSSDEATSELEHFSKGPHIDYEADDELARTMKLLYWHFSMHNAKVKCLRWTFSSFLFVDHIKHINSINWLWTTGTLTLATIEREKRMAFCFWSVFFYVCAKESQATYISQKMHLFAAWDKMRNDQRRFRPKSSIEADNFHSLAIRTCESTFGFSSFS